MSKTKKVPDRVRVKTGGPDYVEILADKAAELAILRVPELSSSRPQNGKSSALFDFIVSADSGICFLVKIESYSASHLKMGEPDAIPVLELSMSADYARIACHSPTPVVLFLFDGDRGHGRYLRLDTLPTPADGAKTVVLAFPVENTITGDSIRTLAAEFARERRVPVAG